MATEREKERELVDLFEAARKAAEAAEAEGGGGAEESRCLDALSQLKTFPVTAEALIATQVGKRLRPLTKHAKKNIQDLASEVFAIWKTMVLEQVKGDGKNGASDHNSSVRAKLVNSKTTVAEKVQTTTSVKPVRVSMSEVVKPEKINQNGSSLKMNSIPKCNYQSGSSLKKSSIPKCNDPLRDKTREQIFEALCKVYDEVSEELRDQVNACDPIQVAVSVESVMFEKWGRPGGNHKMKYRSLMFNLKDGKNPDFRRKVLLGQIEPERVANLSVEEMASDARQLENEQIKEKALLDCQLGAIPNATTDQFKCGRCGKRKTTYRQMQTRSADEPMTTYVTCVNCNNHWKFC